MAPSRRTLTPPSSAAATTTLSPRGRRGLAPATATLLALRFILSYKGSILHALTEPMGDNIIAPFYRYLRYQRNVKFEFFCRVKKLELSSEAPIVDRVILGQQVGCKSTPYNPLSCGRTVAVVALSPRPATRSSTATRWRE